MDLKTFENKIQTDKYQRNNIERDDTQDARGTIIINNNILILLYNINIPPTIYIH